MYSQTRLHLINSHGNNQEEGWREGKKGKLGKKAKEQKMWQKEMIGHYEGRTRDLGVISTTL
jgi:hypothetical protein